MVSLQILDIKEFMSHLLIQHTFDTFWLSEASITTFAEYSIDGRIRKEFYDTEKNLELEQENRTQILWEDIRPFCFSIIKGKRTPLHFKIVFQLPRLQMEELLSKNILSFSPEEIYGLYLNLQYDGTNLNCTSGTSLKTFTMDRSLEQIWDEAAKDFFRKQQITFL